MTGTVLKILLLIAIFAAVLGATYPIQKQAVEEEKATHYDNQVLIEANRTRSRYLAAVKHPEKLDELLAAGDAYASALTSQQLFDQAAKIYQDQLMLTWGRVNNAYNEKWANANMHLAGVLRDMDSQSPALICYESVLKHDQQFLPPTDLRIARDLNNMGLMEYMIGMGKAEMPDRLVEFKKSRDYLEKALALFTRDGQGSAAKAAATMWNLYLTCRDMGDEGAANQYRDKAQIIDKSLNRLCREP